MVFRYESGECRYESERKVHIISFAVAEMLVFSTFVTRVGLQSILWRGGGKVIPSYQNSKTGQPAVSFTNFKKE